MIDDQHAAFTDDPWLFGINDDLSAEDPMVNIRIAACQASGEPPSKTLMCDVASAGHPNARGAKAYAEAIYNVLQQQGQR